MADLPVVHGPDTRLDTTAADGDQSDDNARLDALVVGALPTDPDTDGVSRITSPVLGAGLYSDSPPVAAAEDARQNAPYAATAAAADPGPAATAAIAAPASPDLSITPLGANAFTLSNVFQLSGSGLVTNAQVTDDNSDLAMNGPTARSTYSVDGTGIKIGILSDSFNRLGGMQADINNGDLPASTTIIQDDTVNGEDEGRAMAQLVHRVAPGASIYFYTADNGQSAMATGIKALQAAGCQVIIDDVSYFAEPYYQAGGTISQAVASVVSSGVNYFTSISNNGKDYYEAQFNPMSFTLPGIGKVTAQNVSSGSPYLTVSCGVPTIFDMQWTQPFSSLGGAGTSYGIAIAVYNGKTPSAGSLLGAASVTNTGVDPYYAFQLNAGTYTFAYYENFGSVTAGTFKTIIINNGSSSFTAPSGVIGVGTGTSFGHNDDPSANTVGAIYWNNTPAFGKSPPVQESFSSYGGGKYYYDAAGNLLATPISLAGPTISAPDGSATSVFSPFYGTSAAAPNSGAVAALMLQQDPRLTTAQVSYLLETTAVSTGNSVTGGYGLVDANAAVGGAHTAITTPIWTNQAGTLLWSGAGNWSDNAAPTTGTVRITDGLGLFTGSYRVTDDEASVSLTGLTVDGGKITGASPLLSIEAGDAVTTASFTLGAGSVDVAGSLSIVSMVDGSSTKGAVTIESSGTLQIGGGIPASTITFNGVGGDLVFQTSDSATLKSGLGATITGFAAGDVLDLSGLPVASVASIKVSGSVVTVLDGGGNTLAALTLSGSFSQLGFKQDGGTGTDIVACYCRGTRVGVPGGEVAVEALRIGDLVVTGSGSAKAVKWIGRRSYAGWLAAGNPKVLPVCFKRGSLSDGVPRRDLWVSPEHAMYLDGMLVPAELLVNGVSILKAERVEEVHYYHLELDAHEVILAEGAWAESFVDDDSRGMFHNAAEYRELYPAAPAPAAARYCAPRLEEGFALEALCRRLLGRARRLKPDGQTAAAVLHGNLEVVTHERIAGWAYDPAAPALPLALVALANGAVIGRVVADRYRADLAAAGIGDGRHAFELAVPGGLARDVQHRIEVYREADWTPLPGPPRVLEASSNVAVAAALTPSA